MEDDMKKTLIITTILCITALALGCSTTEPVELNADDVVYSTEGKTVGDTLDKLGNSVATHTHKVVDITDLDLSKYSTVGHGHKASDITGLSPYTKYTDAEARTAMGAKGNTNSFNHDRYGETDLASSTIIKDIQSKLGGGSTTSSDCPSGYKAIKQPKTSFPPHWEWVFCKKGPDYLVKVGDFWIDKYEMVVSSTSSCVGPYPTTYTGFNNTNNWATLLYACSIAASPTPTFVFPSTGLTYYQAQQACTNSGKHLCTNAEWQAAASGTAHGTYNVGNVWPMLETGKNVQSKTTGVSAMGGNVQEWVAGLIFDGTSNTGKALIRGGSYKSPLGTGTDHIEADSPSNSKATLGARCCISGGR